MFYAKRNDAIEFAHRTRKNLEYIEEASEEWNDEVHPIVQLANSLLGLVVFPMARLAVQRFKELPLTDLEDLGWPKVHITLDKDSPPRTSRCASQRSSWHPTTTLYDLVRHLRNSAAHGRMTFSSDSPKPEKVEIRVEDVPPDSKTPHWKAYMTAKELRVFCEKFIELLDNTLG